MALSKVTIYWKGTDGLLHTWTGPTITPPPPSSGGPVARITVTSITNLRVVLSGTSSTDSTAGAQLVSYLWDMGDGTTLNTSTVDHTYAAAGTYTVTLTVIDSFGVGNSTTLTGTVSAPATNTPPVPSFVASPTALSVDVDASASTDNGTIVDYAWSYGDGGAGNGVTDTHVYSKAGNYTITLTCTDDAGAKASTSKNVSVVAANQPPSAVISSVSVAADGVTTSVTSGSSDPDGTITKTAWDFGDAGSGALNPMIAIGDSLTYGQDGGGTTWPAVTAARLGCTVVNAAVTPSSAAGWTSVDAAIRMGSINPALSSAITIPAGTTAVSAPMTLTGQRTSIGTQSYHGTLGGIAGVLQHTTGGTGTYTFTRTTAGSSTPVAAGATFHCTDYDSYVGQGYDLLIMLGRNDINYTGYTATIENSIDGILSRFSPAHYLIIGTIADPDSVFSGDKTNHVTPLDAALKSKYGASHFMSAQAYLASTAALTAVGLTATSTDSSQIAAGDVPDSLSATSDRPHLNSDGYTSLGQQVASTINTLGWGGTSTATGTTASHTYAKAGSYTITLTVTDNQGATSQATTTVTASPAGQQPTGSGIDRYQDLVGATPGDKIRTSTKQVSFPSGTVSATDFADASGVMGIDVTTPTALLGSGLKNTVIQVAPSTSTKTAPTTGTNNYSVLQVRNRTNFLVKDLQVLHTTQQNIYNGLRIQGCTSPTLTNVLIKGFVGTSQSPPGETFGCNIFSITSGATINNCEGDGGGVAASIFATNSFNGTLTINGLYVHDTYSSTHKAAQGACKGLALWQHTGGVEAKGFKGRNNWADMGFERCSGTFNFYDPDLANSQLFGHLGNDGYSTPCKINLYFTSASKLMPSAIKFWCPSTYRGVTNTQSVASDVKVYLDNVLQSGIAQSVAYPA